MDTIEHEGSVTRRSFVKGASVATAALAASGVVLDGMFEKTEPAYADEQNQETSDEKIV